MKMKLIKTEEEYQAALARLEEVFDADPGSIEGDELEVLTLFIEKYEDLHYPIDSPDPIEAIVFRMEQMGLTQTDLAEMIGYRSRASEILSRKRKLTLDMIRKLSRALHIPADVLVQEY